MTIVYKSSIDLFFYVVGSAQENEVRFSTQPHVLSCNLDEAFIMIELKKKVKNVSYKD